jgi:tetratricopeptide (TPR) repeat protein
MEELSEQQHEALEAYLFDRLPTAERQAFEAELATNPALRTELELQRQMRRAMQIEFTRREIAEQYGDLIRQPLEEPTAERQPVVRRLAPIWMAAAAALALALGFVVYLNRDRLFSGTDPQLAQQDTLPRPDTSKRPPVLAPVEPVLPQVAQTDQQLFETYFNSTPKPAPPLQIDPEADAAPRDDSTANARDSVAVRQAIRLLSQGRSQSAIASLQTVVLEGAPGHWRATAEWFLSLTYLQRGQPDEALAIVRRIARTNDHPYQTEARRLRTDLQTRSSNTP